MLKKRALKEIFENPDGPFTMRMPVLALRLAEENGLTGVSEEHDLFASDKSGVCLSSWSAVTPSTFGMLLPHLNKYITKMLVNHHFLF